MAEQQLVSFSDKPISARQQEKEFEEHASTYAWFLQLVKWGVIVNVVILIGLYFIFVH